MMLNKYKISTGTEVDCNDDVSINKNIYMRICVCISMYYNIFVNAYTNIAVHFSIYYIFICVYM